MNIEALRTIVAIADHGSFASAAHALHTSQSTLSMRVKALEDSLRAELFDRTKRPLKLNARGMAIVDRARQIIALYSEFSDLVSDSEDVSGVLVIGAIHSIITGALPSTMAKLQIRHPRLQTRAVQGASDELVYKLDRREIDVAAIPKLDQELAAFKWHPFVKEPYEVLAPNTAEENTDRELLEAYPYIQFGRRASTGWRLDRLLRARGIHVKPIMEIETLEGVNVMVASGLGVAIVPRWAGGLVRIAAVRRIPLADPEGFRILGLLEHTDGWRSKAIRALYNELRQVCWESPPKQ